MSVAIGGGLSCEVRGGKGATLAGKGATLAGSGSVGWAGAMLQMGKGE